VSKSGEGELPFGLEEERPLPTSQKMAFVSMFGYLVAIVIAETLTAYYQLMLGLIFHSVLVFTLIIHSSYLASTDMKLSRLLAALLLAPLIRIFSLATPLWPFTTLQWLFIVTFPLLGAAFSVMYVQGLGRKDVGLCFRSFKKAPIQVGIALLGFPIGIVEFFILQPAAWISSLALFEILQAAFILLLATGLSEELIFRGIILKDAEDAMGRREALIYVSILFASLHIGFLSLADLFFVLLVGLFFGYAVQKTGSILGVTFCHALVNVALYLVIPFYA